MDNNTYYPNQTLAAFITITNASNPHGIDWTAVAVDKRVVTFYTVKIPNSGAEISYEVKPELKFAPTSITPGKIGETFGLELMLDLSLLIGSPQGYLIVEIISPNDGKVEHTIIGKFMRQELPTE